MTWLWVAILSYFFFALASMGDRYLLIGPPNPKIYAFYVGILGIISVVLIPFVGFYIIPGYLALLVGLVFFLSILTLYESLERFEVSRIIPALGGFLPIFTLLLAFLIIGSQEFLGFEKVLSFILLISGSILISIERSIKLSLKSISFAALAAFFLSLYFVLSKLLFSENSFWTSFIWIRIWTFVFTLFLLFFKGVRKEIFAKKKAFSKKTGSIFLINQTIGALAVVLQNWSIALAEAAFISFVSALQGVQYAFLFLFASLFPNILKEKRTKKIVVQKIVAIILIGAGLGILAF